MMFLVLCFEVPLWASLIARRLLVSFYCFKGDDSTWWHHHPYVLSEVLEFARNTESPRKVNSVRGCCTLMK